MHILFQHCPDFASLHRRGFTLVATLSIMILLVLIAVGMLSMASVSLRTTGQEEARRQARANAMLAMQMAIAELQQELGDDRRISADAALLDETSAQPDLVGVWDSWKSGHRENPQERAANLNSVKAAAFRKWLVSSPNPVEVKAAGFPLTAIQDAEAVALFNESRDGLQLSARPVNVGDGSYAWAVTQENTKARINLGVDATPGGPNDRIQAPPRPHLAVSDSLDHPQDGWPERAAKVISREQATLDPGYGVNRISARHFTTDSRSVLANVADGGLKTDLSLAFELNDDDFDSTTWDDLPNPFRGGNAPGGEVPVFQPINSAQPVSATVEFGSATETYQFQTGAVPTFDLLRSHYRQYKHLYDTASGVTAFHRQRANPYWSASASETAPGVHPALNRMMFFTSLWIDGDGLMNVVLTPLVVLWNPFDIAIESPGYVLHPRIDFPMFVEWSVTPASGPAIFTRYSLAGHLSQKVAGGRQVPPYFYLELTARGNGLTSTPIRLEAGEVRLFAPVTSQPIRYQRNGSDRDRTLRMRPVTSLDDLNTGGGFALRQSDGQETERNLTHVFRPGDRVRLTTSFEASRFHYLVTMEDAGRMLRRDPQVLTEIKLYHGYGSDGKDMRLTTPEYDAATLRGGPRPYGVLETFQRTAAQTGQLSDLLLTVNPRQRYAFGLLSGGQFTSSPHYETSFRPIADIIGAGLQVTQDGRRTFFGPTHEVGSGRDQLSFFEIPRAAPISLAQFQHADLVDTAFAPGNVFGNSWASPYLASPLAADLLPRASSTLQETFNPAPGLATYDHPFLLNHALWDGFFMSSISPVVSRPSLQGRPGMYDSETVTTRTGIEESLRAWVGDPSRQPLRNPRMSLHRGGVADEGIVATLISPSGPLRAAGHLMVDGAFNINSVSVEAWAAMLASLRGGGFEIEDPATGDRQTHESADATPFPRMATPRGAAADPWNGFRELSEDDIRKLAAAIVDEVRARGPFLSLAEFVNRRLGTGDMALKGALQAAIDNSGLNRDSRISAFQTTAYPQRRNISDPYTGVGIPGWLTQADLLTGLAPVITPRSDTFVIRTMGEAGPPGARVRVYCEAVVQRMPEWLDASQDAATPMDMLNATNARFGRRFEVIRFKTLNERP